MSQGTWTLTASLGGAYSHAEHDVSPDQFEPHYEHDHEQAHRHVLDFGMFRAQLSGSYGFREWLTLKGQLPVRLTYVKADFLDHHGTLMEDFDSIHHRDEVVAGLGDPVIAGRFKLPMGWLSDSSAAGLTVGVSLPIGGIESDPFLRGNLGLEHQHVFFGTGT